MATQGHPINPHLRAQGLPDLPQQIGNITLENDVWVGTRVSIIGNVTNRSKVNYCNRECGN